MRVALIQMSVTADRARNITAACQHIRRAAEGGADIVVLPEMFCCPYDNGCFRAYGEAAGGPAQMALSQTAAELGIYVVGGSLPELEGGKVYNTCYVYGRRGSFGKAPEGPSVRHRRGGRPALYGVGHSVPRGPDHHL